MRGWRWSCSEFAVLGWRGGGPPPVSACGHAERGHGIRARHQRQFAAGVGPCRQLKEKPARPPNLSHRGSRNIPPWRRFVRDDDDDPANRRRFLKLTGLAGTALLVESAVVRSAWGQNPMPVRSSIDTPVLKIAYEESGDPQGFPIILLHGFPDDVRAFDGVVPPLVARRTPGAGAVSARLRSHRVP